MRPSRRPSHARRVCAGARNACKPARFRAADANTPFLPVFLPSAGFSPLGRATIRPYVRKRRTRAQKKPIPVFPVPSPVFPSPSPVFPGCTLSRGDVPPLERVQCPALPFPRPYARPCRVCARTRMPVAGAYASRVYAPVRSRLRPPRVSVRVSGRVSARVRPYGYARALGDGCAPVSACARVLHIRAGASRAVHGRLCRHKKAAQPAQKRACAGLCAAPFALALKRLARV